jgi:hypothetical protein
MAAPLATHLPPRDRRRHPRILTLKNYSRLLLAASVIYAGLTILANHGRQTPGQYGRLYGKQQPAVGKAQFNPPIVTEAPAAVPEQERADPMLLDAAARSQYLGTGGGSPGGTGSAASSTAPPATATTTASSAIDNSSFGPSRSNAPLRQGQKVTIVGDSNGVTVVKQ